MCDAATNLGNAYISIRRAGCIQFDDLLVVIHCDPSNENSPVAIEIKLKQAKVTVLGYKDQKSALKQCQDLHSYLNDCLRDWKQHMDSFRRLVVSSEIFLTSITVWLVHN